jgi:hypothetical protein
MKNSKPINVNIKLNTSGRMFSEGGRLFVEKDGVTSPVLNPCTKQQALDFNMRPMSGSCCHCGYRGRNEDHRCASSSDGQHCDHWCRLYHPNAARPQAPRVFIKPEDASQPGLRAFNFYRSSKIPSVAVLDLRSKAEVRVKELLDLVEMSPHVRDRMAHLCVSEVIRSLEVGALTEEEECTIREAAAPVILPREEIVRRKGKRTQKGKR